MKIFKHPVTWFVIGAAALVVGILLDVTPADLQGKIISAIIIACIVLGIITGVGYKGKK